MKILYLTNIKPDEFNFLQIAGEHYGHDMHLIGGRDEYRFSADITLHDSRRILVNLGKAFNKIGLSGRGYFIKHSGLVDRVRPNLVHAISANTWGSIAAILPKAYPMVLTCTGSDIFRYPFRNKQIFQQVHYALHRADRIHVLSSATVKHLVTHFDLPYSKISYSPWGINLRAINQVLEDTNPVQTKASLGFEADDIILFAPRGIRSVFRPIGDLVEIVAPLMLADARIKLIIMMHVREDEELENKIRQDVALYGLENRVAYIERFLPHNEMIALFQAADVTISLAESDETSLAALEAMYCNTIPVLSKTLTYPESFTEEENIFFVENGHIEANRMKLVTILDHLDYLKEAMGERNRQIIERDYDRHKNIHKIQQIYQTTMETKP